MSLLSELRRRNVFRMAVLYAVAAWLIMQVVEVLMSLVGLQLRSGWSGLTATAKTGVLSRCSTPCLQFCTTIHAWMSYSTSGVCHIS